MINSENDSVWYQLAAIYARAVYRDIQGDSSSGMNGMIVILRTIRFRKQVVLMPDTLERGDRSEETLMKNQLRQCNFG